MKKRCAHWLRSALCLMLAVLLAVGTCVTAFAADEPEDTKETINYVSIGDSMTNGYCFTGYAQGGSTNNSYDFLKGLGVYGEGAYPLQFEKYLEEKGYNVNHTKLAPSATLAGDLWYVLGGRDLPLDGWGGMFDYVGNYRSEQYRENVDYNERCAGEELKEYYQNAVETADIMTLCLGNAEFGAYLMDRLTTALGLMGATTKKEDYVTLQDALNYSGLDSTQQALVQQVYSYLTETLKSYAGDDLWAQYHLGTVCDMLAYATAGFLFNYKGVLDEIISMNPDVEIIQIGLMNTTYGMTVSLDDGSAIPVGDIMDGLFGTINAYIAGLPTVMQLAGEWEDATFYYAEQPNPLFISQQFAELKEKNWGTIDNGRLDGSIVRDRNVTAFNEVFVKTKILAGIINVMTSKKYESALTIDALKISLNDITSYEANATNYVNNNPLKQYSVIVYLALEDALAESTKTQDIPLSSLTTLTNMEALMGVFSDFDPASADIRGELAKYLTSTDELKGMMKIYALFKVGNGMSVHPTPSGHDNIAASVIAAYDGKYTSKDKTKDNVLLALDSLYDILEKYGPEAMDYAYQYALENGYIEQLEAALEQLKAELLVQAGDYVDELIPAIESTIAALQGEAEQLKAQLETLKAALEAKYDELRKQLETAGENVSAAVEQAIAETEKAIAAINGAIEQVEDVLAQVNAAVEQLQQTLAVITESVEQLYDAAVAIGDSVEEMLEVLAASAELSVDKAVAAVNAAKAAVDEAVELLANVETTLSDAIGNVSEVVEAMTAAFDGLFGDALDALDGVAGVLSDIAADTAEEAIAALNAAAQAQIDALRAELESKLDEATAALNEKLAADKAQLDALAQSIANEAAAKKAELEAAAQAQIDALQQQLAEKYAELEALAEETAQEVIDEINAQIAEIEAQITAAQNELAAAIEAAQNEIAAAYAETKAALEAEIASLEAEIAAAAAELQAEVDAQIAAINAELAEATAKLQAAADEAAAVIDQIVGGAIDSADEAKAAAEALYAEVASVVAELAEQAGALADDVMVQVQTKIEEIVAAWNNAYDAATGAEYAVTPNSYYVALGDGSAVSESYVDMLAEYLGVDYANLAAADQSVETAGAVIAANVDKIVKADLITLGYSNASFANKVLKEVLGKKTLELDWSTFVTDEGVQYVEAALAQIRQLLVDNDISGNVMGYDLTDAVMTFIESYAFSCVAYACGLPELVNAIHEINPEAVVVIVGQYNPFAGTTLDLGGVTVDLGEYVDYLVDAAAVHATAYCMLTGNAIYVDAPNAAVNNTKTELDASDLTAMAVGSGAELYPSEAGHMYIGDKILNALDIKPFLWGDANGDGVVNISDVRLVHRYVAEYVDETELNLAVCDVNGDGLVNVSDVREIHRYALELIDHFTVEE